MVKQGPLEAPDVLQTQTHTLPPSPRPRGPRCLSPDAERRPDVVEVSASISDIMMSLMDSFYASHHALQRRADRDRKRAQKYFLERHKGQMGGLISGPPQVVSHFSLVSRCVDAFV